MDFSDSNIQRTHDLFYLENDKNEDPKECFVKIADLIEPYLESSINKDEKITIADIGCAAGQFPAYLDSRFENISIIGYEYLEELVEAASHNFPNVNFKQASILDINAIQESSCEVITISGVLSIFDDISPIIENLAYWIKPNGKLILFGVFNPYDIDVFVKYRHSEDYEINTFESGWNIISQKTISKLLHANGAKNINFHEFQLSIDLKERKYDPVRSWTEKLDNGSTQIVNGLRIKQPAYIVEVDF